MIVKNIMLVALPLLLGTVLVACGDDTDKGTGKSSMEKPAMQTSTEPAMAPQSESEMASETMMEDTMMEDTMIKGIEDNGVIYQDEIYKNWPSQ